MKDYEGMTVNEETGEVFDIEEDFPLEEGEMAEEDRCDEPYSPDGTDPATFYGEFRCKERLGAATLLTQICSSSKTYQGFHNLDTSRICVGQFYSLKKLHELVGEEEKPEYKNHSKHFMDSRLRLFRCFMDISEEPHGKQTRYRVNKIYSTPIIANYLYKPRNCTSIFLAEALYTYIRSVSELTRRKDGFIGEYYIMSGSDSYIMRQFGFQTFLLQKYIWTDIAEASKQKEFLNPHWKEGDPEIYKYLTPDYCAHPELNYSVYKVIADRESDTYRVYHRALRTLSSIYLFKYDEITLNVTNDKIEEDKESTRVFRSATQNQTNLYNSILKCVVENANFQDVHEARSSGQRKKIYEENRDRFIKAAGITDFRRERRLTCSTDILNLSELSEFTDEELKSATLYCSNLIQQLIREREIKFMSEHQTNLLDKCWRECTPADKRIDYSTREPLEHIPDQLTRCNFVTDLWDQICGIREVKTTSPICYADYLGLLYDQAVNEVVGKKLIERAKRH